MTEFDRIIHIIFFFCILINYLPSIWVSISMRRRIDWTSYSRFVCPSARNQVVSKKKTKCKIAIYSLFGWRDTRREAGRERRAAGATHQDHVCATFDTFGKESLCLTAAHCSAVETDSRLYTILSLLLFIVVSFLLAHRALSEFLFWCFFFVLRLWCVSDLIWQKTTERFVWTWIYKLYCSNLCSMTLR